MVDQYYELCSMLELCFGDEEQEEGLAGMLEQLEIYPHRRAPVTAQLKALLESEDREQCRLILSEYAHFSASPDASFEWFQWLNEELGFTK